MTNTFAEDFEAINSNSCRSTNTRGETLRPSSATTKPYYRSITFTSKFAVNPLVAAASTLLSLNAKLKLATNYRDISNLHQHLVHEVKAFASNAQNHGYHVDSTLVARYLLCATLDETILNTSWGKNSLWRNHLLLNTFQKEKQGDQRFFQILEQISEQPDQYLDLLELIYLCLSSGFEGKYRREIKGKDQIDTIMNKLYQCIRLHREDPEPLFLIPSKREDDDKSNTSHSTPAIWKVLLFTCLLIISLFVGFNYLFEVAKTPMYQELQSISQLLQSSNEKY